MKKIVLLSLVITGIVLKGFSQEAASAAIGNPNAAEIVFENDVHDYGSIKQGANGSYEFKFKNSGKEPLIISNAQGSCGCTVPAWPKDLEEMGQVVKVEEGTIVSEPIVPHPVVSKGKWHGVLLPSTSLQRRRLSAADRDDARVRTRQPRWAGRTYLHQE